ncbi:hypothetical protein RhiirB3_532535 [Rhizophagus irregularis]|nr:hypothetical protein RhiirB3_532535 [Rhizophagus irregularis]
MGKDANQFNQADELRLQLIKSKLLGPEFSEEAHSKAIYTSRSLSSFTSKSSSNSLMNLLKQKLSFSEYSAGTVRTNKNIFKEINTPAAVE